MPNGRIIKFDFSMGAALRVVEPTSGECCYLDFAIGGYDPDRVLQNHH